MPHAAPGYRFELVSMPHVRYDAAVAFEGVRAVNYDLHLIHYLQGRGVMRLGDRRASIRPGTAWLIPPLTPYACDKRSGAVMEMVNIHFHFDLDGVPLLSARRLPTTFTIDSRAHESLRRWAKGWASGDALLRARVAADVHRYIVQCVSRHDQGPRTARPTDELMARLRSLIRLRMHGPYDSRALADLVHLSVSQMNRRFRAAYGISVRTYYERHRLARIQSALRSTDWSMKRLAMEFGFRDQFYFSRYVRRWSGMSPTAFRRRHRL